MTKSPNQASNPAGASGLQSTCPVGRVLGIRAHAYAIAKSLGLLLASSAILLAVVAVAVVVWFHGGRGVPQIPFDSSSWKQAREIGDHRTVRSQMIVDLLRHQPLKGKSADDISALLGKPDVVAWDGWDFGYRLGLERGNPFGNLDGEFLVFQLDKSMHVKTCLLTTD